MKNQKLEDYPVGKKPEHVLDWLYRFNRDSEYGMPMPTSVAKKAIQDIKETRSERNLYMVLFVICLLGVVILTFYTA